jgi:nucleotidyltransferase substrate binding protein (TIGR01987 family)
MDAKLKYKLSQMGQMLHTLEQSTTAYAKKLMLHDLHSEEVSVYRDSVIKRLEYCVDHFWKLLKTYLEESQGVAVVENGPKPIARIAALHNILSEQESQQLITMIQERNNTAHMYKQEIADEIARFAPQGLLLMKTILARLNKNSTQQETTS